MNYTMKNYRTFIILYCTFLFSVFSINAQTVEKNDRIVLSDNSSIEGNIIEVTRDSIFYINNENSMSINRNEVRALIYSDNSIVMFDPEKTMPVSQSTDEIIIQGPIYLEKDINKKLDKITVHKHKIESQLFPLNQVDGKMTVNESQEIKLYYQDENNIWHDLFLNVNLKFYSVDWKGIGTHTYVIRRIIYEINIYGDNHRPLFEEDIIGPDDKLKITKRAGNKIYFKKIELGKAEIKPILKISKMNYWDGKSISRLSNYRAQKRRWIDLELEIKFN